MKNKKINRIIAGSVILILVLFLIVFIIFNYTTDENSFSIVEKKWITSNTNNIIDVNVFNDVPIYGYNGSGISFSFLDAFSKDNNIKFNKISYYSSDDVDYKNISFRVLDINEKLEGNDILFYEDNYVILSTNADLVNSLDDVDNIGILSSDKDSILKYLGEKKYKIYDDIDSLVKGIKTLEVNYALVPNIMYSKEILANSFNIIYHVSDLSKKYVLRVDDDIIYDIMKKYYNKYMKNNYIDNYSYEFLNIYFSSTKTSDLLRKNYNAKIYKYGYVVNMPYEDSTASSFVGTISNYLNDFTKIINADIEVVRYDTIDDLKNALVSGDVDFALTNFDYQKLNMNSLTTLSFNNEEYVVLSKNNIPITTIKGLSDYKVSVVGSSNLYYMCASNGIDTKIFSDTNDLIRNIDDDSVVVMDKATYIYYKGTKLDDYKIIYEDKIDGAYRFIVNKNNETFYNLLDYYVSSRDYRNIRYDYNTTAMIDDDNNSLRNAIWGIIIIIVIGIFVLIISNRRSNNIKLSKEDKLKYIDPMTSLKNRNYLNHNIYNWDDNVIFPQAVIVFDINKTKEINDKFGREAGDDIIKKTAGILINNQLENTDIIRSGGDEFLIYMVGYDKNSVIDYAKKLSKDMKKIPNSCGVEFGYSMILDEVKSVDDAINESIAMMEKNKSKR